jgi:hypothetical protein
MRRRISDIRKEVRSREKEFNRLRRDNWIRINSEIEAQKFHALMIMLSKIFSIRRWGKAVTVAGIAAS